MEAKKVDALTVADFERCPIWEYIYDEVNFDDETWVQAVNERPVSDLTNRVIGVKVRLHSGIPKWAELDNIDLGNHLATTQFMGISLEHEGRWVHLARYFDVTYDRDGPDALASTLGLPLDEVFPIFYDISELAIGPENILINSIPAIPEMRLSEQELLKLSMGS